MKENKLTLFHSPNCGYCSKVKQIVVELDLDVEYINIRSDPDGKSELLRHGGKAQIPCLRVCSSTGSQWIYESQKIIKYLSQNYSLA